jgi:hypothetical protein
MGMPRDFGRLLPQGLQRGDRREETKSKQNMMNIQPRNYVGSPKKSAHKKNSITKG